MNTPASPHLIFDTTPDLQHAVADAAANLLRRSVHERGIANVSLSGGSTPRRIYELLASQDLPWENIHWFWGDERNVTADSEQSNERMVRETLFNNHPALEGNLHPVTVDITDPASGAVRYQNALQNHFSNEMFPAWDLVLLGLGDDAHTASLFPGTEALKENERWFVHNWVEKLNTYRYTLTAPAINSGKNIWFLVAGENKRDALEKVWSEEQNPNLYPSQLIRPTKWYLTQNARP